MKGKRLYILLSVLALLLVTGVVLLTGRPHAVAASTLPAPAAQQPDNSTCLGCHGGADKSTDLPNGDKLNIAVDGEMFANSVHANISCQNCHVNISGYPHPANSAQTAREYTMQYKDACKTCHADQAKTQADSVHAQKLAAGDTNAPVCADCHNPHTQVKVQKKEDGTPAGSEHAKIALTCATCHSKIYDEYLQSVHGSGIIDNKNPDVPACTDCHGVHTISDPNTARFRNSSIQMCARCHTDANIMDKYGLSTQVLNTYVADFHGTTVTLFQKTNPDEMTNKPVCYDCHGVHNIARTDDPQKGLQMKENMLAACQKCHPDATDSFPDSWLSHYIPSPEKYPLVYYVGLFYKILIPVVLGGMAVYVLSDVYFRFILKRRKAASQAAKEE